MSIKLTPARLRQIVMEEAAAMRAETKKFRLTESQLRQIIRQELNEAFGAEGNNPKHDVPETPIEQFSDCDFVVSSRGLAVEEPGGLGSPTASKNLLDKILDALGDEIGVVVDEEDLHTALELKSGELGAQGRSDDVPGKIISIANVLDDVCPRAKFKGLPL